MRAPVDGRIVVVVLVLLFWLLLEHVQREAFPRRLPMPSTPSLEPTVEPRSKSSAAAAAAVPDPGSRGSAAPTAAGSTAAAAAPAGATAPATAPPVAPPAAPPAAAALPVAVGRPRRGGRRGGRSKRSPYAAASKGDAEVEAVAQRPALPLSEWDGAGWRLPQGGWRRRRDLSADIADAAAHLRVVRRGSGGEWALLCSSRVPMAVGVSSGVTGGRTHFYPRCVLHLRRCATRFRVFAYNLSTLHPGPGYGLRAIDAALRRGRLRNIRADSPAEACAFVLGVDAMLRGGYLRQVGSHPRMTPNMLLRALHPHAAPPFRSWVEAPDVPPSSWWQNVSGRDLWGLNHLGIQLNDQCTECELGCRYAGCYAYDGMAAVRGESDNMHYQRWLDVSTGAQRQAGAAPHELAQWRRDPASRRKKLIFFAARAMGEVHTRNRLLSLRKHGVDGDVAVFLYCEKKQQPPCSPRERAENAVANANGLGFQLPNPRGDLAPPVSASPGFVRGMGESTFCLVARGTALLQSRLTEAMWAGCIPVIVQPGNLSRNDWLFASGYRGLRRMVLPLDELVDWPRLSIEISEDDLARDPGAFVEQLRRLKARAEDVDAMQRLGIAAADEAFDGLDRVFEEVVRLMRYRALVFEEMLSSGAGKG